ncbi:hypothetical protein F5Y04DRAFT_281720 [Hypomontagnella monticulosa]|nr:hypothetical protein F5Y04DRAFT_281720 [Hypomontagnella monticulosa]
MRLDVSGFGILACLMRLAVAQDDGNDDRGNGGAAAGAGTATTGSSPNQVIRVASLPTPAVYVENEADQVISYSWGQGITELTIRCVNLKEYTTNHTIAQGTVNGHVPLSTGTKRYDDKTIDRRGILPDLPFPVTNDTITLLLNSTVFEALYGRSLKKPLYYEFEWENSTSRGASYSQLLAVVDVVRDKEVAQDEITKTGKEGVPAFAESFIDPSSNPETSTTAAATPASETAAQATAQEAPNGGLSTGAIAGIAVGCAVAGILIIAFLVWFFFFRRRSSRERVHRTEFAADSGTMMADKEMVGITSSPRSTFPSDGRLHEPRSSMVRPDDSSYAPYSDRAPSPPAPPGAAFTTNSQTDLSSVGRPSTTTPPFQTRYAHLIEEGMTEAEIRRLEEEERHLDAAIEDAGRNSRSTHHQS